MVKAFVKGLLKRKDKKEESKTEDTPKEEKSKEDVPDELPPLADDSIDNLDATNKVQDTGNPPKEAADISNEDIPDELPSLDEHKEEASKNSLFDNFYQKEPDIEYHKEPQKRNVNVPGFFSCLLTMSKKQGINKKLLGKDLYQGMKNYYSVKSGTDMESTSQNTLEKEISNKLEKLKTLENNWRQQKDIVEKNQQALLDQEKEIMIKTKEILPLLKKLNVYEDVPIGKYFRSHDGVIVKNVYELLDLLKVTDEKVYRSHNNDKRNDFALWIKNIVKDTDLAKKLENIKSKEEMIFILESAAIGKLEEIQNIDYFKPKKGAIIKDPSELSSVLKNMDLEIFNFHVNKKKNDFYDWIKNSFHEDGLLEKLKACSEKEAMIKTLEDYYSKK
ncbi:MAG: hypothetical protein ABIC04_02550 [Nanoarchaeota archaeon]